MPIICPTILANDAHEFQTQMNRIKAFSKRIQIDLTDGVFAQAPTIALEQVWVPDAILADLHLMYQSPLEKTDEALKLNPHMIIIHAEAEGNFIKLADKIHKQGVKVGVALMAKTSTHILKPSLSEIDHILIFSGDLGKFGGIADLHLLSKVKQLKEWKDTLEFGWDGGVNNNNAKLLAEGGVDVLNVGGFIQNSPDPLNSFNQLNALIA